MAVTEEQKRLSAQFVVGGFGAVIGAIWEASNPGTIPPQIFNVTFESNPDMMNAWKAVRDELSGIPENQLRTVEDFVSKCNFSDCTESQRRVFLRNLAQGVGNHPLLERQLNEYTQAVGNVTDDEKLTMKKKDIL